MLRSGVYRPQRRDRPPSAEACIGAFRSLPTCTQKTAPFDGFLLGKRYLLRAREAKFAWAFDTFLKDGDVEPLLLPPRGPHLHAYCERFVRSIKDETLQHKARQSFLYLSGE